MVGRLRGTSVLALGLLTAAVVAGPVGATNDPHWDKQWGPVKVGAPQAWATTTGAGVVIGVVDTGIDLGHEDLGGKVAASTACIGTGGDPGRCGGSAQDTIGHGTHVAGIAAAAKDNGRGIAGIAPDARLAVARVFDGDGAEIDDVNAGIRWVVDRGARVVNLSVGESGGLLGGLLGGGGSSLSAGIEYAWSKGAVPVLAAGNVNFFGLGSANYGNANAVVVGATGRNDEPAAYSSPTGNAKWAMSAPGGNGAQGGQASQIYSAYVRPGSANQYGYLEGTSMAAPHVSGALALLLSRPGMTPDRAVSLLISTANKSVGCGGGNCAGRLDVAAAVAATGPASPPPPAPAPPPPPPAPAPPTTTRPRPTTTSAPAARPPTPAPAPAPTPAPTPAPPPAPEAPTPPPPEPAPEQAPAPDEAAVARPSSAAGPSPGGDGGTSVTGPGLGALALLLAVGGAAAAGARRRQAAG